MDEYPILNKFCYTTEELHEEYGLSIEGKVAKDLSSYDLPDDEWLTLFQHRYQKNAKVYFHHLQASFIDDCRLLFHKAYQGPPSCGEITTKCAICSKPGGLDKKVENWKRANKAFHGGLLGSNKKRHYTQGANNMCNIEQDKVLEFETMAVDYISDLDAIVHGVLTSSTQTLNRLSELRASLQEKKESLLRLEGSNAVTKKIKEDVLLFEQHLDELHRQVPCDIDEIKDVEADLNAHQYHPFCFAAPLMKKDICAKVGCNERISKVAKTWAHKGHVQKKYEVKEKYTDNHAADKHSKAGHIFYEEMKDGGLKSWWLDEPTVIERNPPKDIPASKGTLIILDVNEMVLKGWSRLPKDERELQHALQGMRVNNFCIVKLRPSSQDFLEALVARASVMIWSCCMKPKLMQILKTCFPKAVSNPKIIKEIFSQKDCEIWRDSFKCVLYVGAKFWQKPVFLRRVWKKHPQFNSSNTILLEDTRYKSLKIDYDNCLSIHSFDLGVEPEGSSYLVDIVEPWLLEGIRAPCPLAYCKKHPLFDVEDDLSPLIAEYFVAMEGYLYWFDSPNMCCIPIGY
ncbi:hypothetical protein L7F22_032426 [Adiantum nelumboides]|nr:hypothetical protein [Adiantum nelumboides]